MILEQLKEYVDADIRGYSEPLLESYAFQRLKEITFLGILSPKYFELFNPTLKKIIHPDLAAFDGTRAEHSIGVANIILNFTDRLNFSFETKKYAVCWGLLHDIATWPLSHTSEPAFTISTGVSSGELRRMMILGDKRLPGNLNLSNILNELEVDADILMSLFEKTKGAQLDNELNFLWEIIHSPITPDTLEGMWRTGKVYNVSFPEPEEYESRIASNLFDTYISKKDSKLYLDFWRKKSQVYKKIINNRRVLVWESAWSFSIYEYFKDLGLVDSLELPEKEIVQIIETKGIIESEEIFKYKSPQRYYIHGNKRILKNVNVLELRKFLLSYNNLLLISLAIKCPLSRIK